MISRLESAIPAWLITDPPENEAEKAQVDALIDEHWDASDQILQIKGFSLDDDENTIIKKASSIASDIKRGLMPGLKGFIVKYVHVWMASIAEERIISLYLSRNLTYIS